MSARLAKPPAELALLAGEVRHKPELVEAAIAATTSDTARVKFGASKILRMVSEQAPEMLYSHFDFFAGQLAQDNSILRWNAMLVLANLARVDRERKLDRILDAYLAPIPGPKLIDAANVIRGAAAIALAKPYLADRIAARVLAVERASYATPECRNVAIGHAIRTLGQIFALLQDQRAVREFAARQVRNTRQATRRKAERFLTAAARGSG